MSLFSEEDIDKNINLEDYPERVLQVLCHLYNENKRGRKIIPQNEFNNKLYIPRASVSYSTNRLEDDGVIEKIPLGRRRKGIRLIRGISEEEYKKIRVYLVR